ncbi:MAG: KamA family radical SAM protein [Myxococcota bacterium]|nr:KamA family radical SAM protein [Myxococcota bacterium]
MTAGTHEFDESPSTGGGVSKINHLKPQVDPATLEWRDLRRDAFWQRIPAWKDVDEETFLDHRWQDKNAITSPKKLMAVVNELVSEEFIEDVEEGFSHAPMAVRMSPYAMALIDWEAPYADPIRRQFLPLGSQLLPDHPMLTLDSLGEQADAPVPGLTHRYPDKALFLVLDTCPVYCRFCTRSYAVGSDTEEVEKVKLRVNQERWERAFQYMRERPELEDVVISGGDTYRLKPSQILEVGNGLLDIPHIRRFRFATKGPAIMPMKILTDEPWLDALTQVVERGRAMGKEVALHTHFNHPNEITGITEDAMGELFQRGITVRNQSVFQRGVNDLPEVMVSLSRRLSYMNVHPYYVYIHDLVKGTEDLRTTVARGIQVEKRLRGATAGFNTPTFVVDAPGGGGKRDVHSFEYYDQETGVSVYTAPSVKAGKLFTYFDPVDELSPAMQQAWGDPKLRHEMIHDALSSARKATI